MAPCLGLAHVQGLHHAHLRILTQIIQGEAIAVSSDDAGDDEQQRPQEHEDILHDLQQDDLARKQESVKQGGVRGDKPLAHVHGVQDVPRAQHRRHQ